MPCPISNWDAQRASARYEHAAPSWGVLCHQALTVERIHGFSRLAARTPRAWRTPEEPRSTIGHDRPIPSGALRCASCSGAAAPLTPASWGRLPWGALSYGSHHRATALMALMALTALTALTALCGKPGLCSCFTRRHHRRHVPDLAKAESVLLAAGTRPWTARRT